MIVSTSGKWTYVDEDTFDQYVELARAMYSLGVVDKMIDAVIGEIHMTRIR
jgi:hypothetical protein